MGKNPTSINFGATRMAMPVMIVSVIALATPLAARDNGTTSAVAAGVPGPS
jgi:hypothetical protein